MRPAPPLQLHKVCEQDQRLGDVRLAKSSSLGQFNASLATFSRTIDEYNQLAKQELVPAKQEKAFERVKNFRADLTDFREQFELVKKEREETVPACSC